MHKQRFRYWLPLIIITLVALELRLYCLDCYGLWYDEVASIEIARRGPWAILTDRFGGMLVQTPFHYLLVWLTQLPVDPVDTAALVRLPSVLAGALTVPAVYGLGRMMFGRGAGLIGALLLALSPVHIAQSQDVRPYALLMLFTTLSVYTLLRVERAGARRWWWGFAGATIAALYTSYFGLTLFLPPVLLYLLWVLYSAWRCGGAAALRPAFVALSAIAAASIPVLLDVLRVERTAPDLLLVTPAGLLNQQVLLPTRLAQIGWGGVGEAVAQWALFALAVLGAIAAIRSGRGRYAALCALMLIIPALELALFRTTNQVFQRYAFFAMPFYLLPVAYGVATLGSRFKVQGSRLQTIRTSPLRVAFHVLRGGLAAGVVLLFALGAYLYFKPEEHRRFSYLPDYRGAARYLAEAAKPGDMVVLLDEPALGAEVVNFYWHDNPPALVHDARDPRLFSSTPSGDIFWVVSFFQNDPDFIRDLPSYDARWAEVAFFERITVLRERGPVVPSAAMARLVAELQHEVADFQPVLTLRGELLQSQGRVDEAAVLYRLAGAYYPRLGAEFLVTAQGFLQRREQEKAWREALTSFFMQPADPRIHDLLAALLAAQGYSPESLVAREMAERLREP